MRTNLVVIVVSFILSLSCRVMIRVMLASARFIERGLARCLARPEEFWKRMSTTLLLGKCQSVLPFQIGGL